MCCRSGVRITSLNVKQGDTVKAGDVIATFDTASLRQALDNKEAAYERAMAAYEKSKTESKQASSKIANVKKQITELEAQLNKLQNSQPTTAANSQNAGVTVSDSLVKRFVRIAKLMGVEYTRAEAEKVLVRLLSAGNSVSDLSSMMDSLGAMAGSSGSFDFSSLASMGGAGSMTTEMSLIQLKAQLATLELQSDGGYVEIFKTIADKTKEDYVTAQEQLSSMKNGWIAEAKGLVSEVNINDDGTAKQSNAASDIDISSVLSAVTSGGNVSELLSAFINNGTTAVKVLYYPLVADISLSKYDVLEVGLNQSVLVTSASGREFEGKVSYVSSVATSGSGININSLMGGSASSSTIPAQVTIENADKSVIVGADVDVSIVTNTVENAIVVPVEAVCIDGTDVFVYVYDNEKGTAVRRDVKLGISNDTYYQVISGVSENDVLIKNTTGLDDGVKVQVK